ncbi:MAG: hypothetical protein ACOY3P_20045 [Planctomycetota bacterium]
MIEKITLHDSGGNDLEIRCLHGTLADVNLLRLDMLERRLAINVAAEFGDYLHDIKDTHDATDHA